MKYKIIFSYDGSHYKGYQIQEEHETVQGKLQHALTAICKEEVKVHASGRTDAGVHAKHQVAHFETSLDISRVDMKNAINAMLPKDIFIRDCKRVSERFHARYDVISKKYQYMINTGEYNPILKDYIYQYNKELDVELMQQALDILTGTHDFTAFTVGELKDGDNVRKLFSATIDVKGDLLVINLVGNGFLRYMVRYIVGMLLKVGTHKLSLEQVQMILDARDRELYFGSAEACGLYLADVRY